MANVTDDVGKCNSYTLLLGVPVIINLSIPNASEDVSIPHPNKCISTTVFPKTY